MERQREKDLSIVIVKLQSEQGILTSILDKKCVFVEQMNLAGLENVRRLADYHGYLDTLLGKAKTQRKLIAAVEKQVETKRQHLLKATQDCKVLERVKEKRMREQWIVEARKEQEFLDELARR